MTEEEYARRKRYAGPTKPSMHRRRIGHDYSSRRMYLITMTVERRQPLLGTLKGTITGIGRFDCTAVGNCFLLEYPQRRQVQHSTHLYEDDIQKAVADNMAAARGGAVLVSPSISEGEKRSMRAAFDAGLPLILITANGLGLYTKPDGAFFDACAEGRLLVVSPFEHQNRKVTLTRQMCMEMNELARLIAEGSDAAADNNPRTKNNETEVIINGLSGLVNDNERSKEPRD